MTGDPALSVGDARARARVVAERGGVRERLAGPEGEEGRTRDVGWAWRCGEAGLERTACGAGRGSGTAGPSVLTRERLKKREGEERAAGQRALQEE